MSPAPVTMLTTPGGSSACWQISAKASAVSGVVSAGFSTTVLPQASAGAIFHASISSGKFHGMTWPATPSGLGVGPEAGPGQLVGPAGVVEEVRRDQRQVDVAGLLDRLAVVDATRARPARASAPGGGGRCGRGTWPARRPGSFDHRVGGPAGRVHGGVDIARAGRGDLGQHLLGGRVDGLEAGAVERVDEATADEQAVRRLDRGQLAGLGRRARTPTSGSRGRGGRSPGRHLSRA